jgi:hypothetical protein
MPDGALHAYPAYSNEAPETTADYRMAATPYPANRKGAAETA